MLPPPPTSLPPPPPQPNSTEDQQPEEIPVCPEKAHPQTPYLSQEQQQQQEQRQQQQQQPDHEDQKIDKQYPPNSPLNGPPPPPPPPLPGPPSNGWSHVYTQARKPVITPKSSMRPLFWNRIQVPQPNPLMPKQSNAPKPPSLWENLEEIKLKDDKLEEFCQLFKRTVTTSSHNFKRNIASKTKETISILDPKRAHTINILVTSRHLSIKDIQNTVYNLDTSIIDVETLKQIHEIAGTKDELQAIEAFLHSEDHVELGKAEQFIRELSMIDSFDNRFKCIMFEVSSSEQIQAIESKLNNFRHMCEFLTTSETIHQILSIVLALGNYMNGGNRDRGQADGFGLEILPKLRDVKSATSSSVTLLHYIVQTYIQTHVPTGIVSFDEVKNPLPVSSDLEQASTVVFDDIDQDLKNLQQQIEECQLYSDQVNGKHQEPFKSHMKKVLKKISKEYGDQMDNLQECIQVFNETSEFFCWSAKTKQPIREFFNCWIPFCRDFHSIFKNELLRRIKSELENVKAKVNADKKARTKDIKTSKANPLGLKARLAKKGLLNNFLSTSFT